MGPLPFFICCEVNSLIRNNAVWNTMMVGEPFSKSMSSSFGRSITHREGTSRLNIYSCKGKVLPAPSVQCNQSATREKTDHPVKWHHIAICFSKIGHSSSHRLVGLVSVWLMHNLHLYHHGHFVRESFRQWQENWGKKLLDIHRTVILPTWLLESSSAEDTFGEYLHLVNIYRQLHILCSFKEIYHIPLPRSPCHQFSNHVLSKSLTMQPHCLSQFLNLYNLIPLAISPSRTTIRCTDWSLYHSHVCPSHIYHFI